MAKLAERAMADRALSFVVFEVGAIRYAFEIHRVQEITRPLEVLEMPHAPDYVMGVAHHHKQVVPVVDLRQRFSLPALGGTRHVRWVLARCGTNTVAFVVDRVIGVVSVSELEGRAVPEIGPGAEHRGILKAYAQGGVLIFTVDADQLAGGAETLAREAGVGSEAS